MHAVSANFSTSIYILSVVPVHSLLIIVESKAISPATIGYIHCLARDIENVDINTGWKSNIFGYMSRGDKVYKVI